MLFFISTKYNQNTEKGIRVIERTGNQIQTQDGEITPKVRKQEFSFLYATCQLILFISTKYHQNILKGMHVTERTWNQIKTQEGEITPKVRMPTLSFLYVTRCLVLFYISTKYHKNIPKVFWLITKTFLFKYTENFTSKNWNFSDKNSDIFSYFCWKLRL